MPQAETPSDFKAAIPEPYQILGLRLLPLSIGRYRLLHRFKVAFVAEGEAMANIGDLILGVAICSMRCDEFLKAFEDGSFFRLIEQWARRIRTGPPWYLRGWLRWLSFTFIGRGWRRRHSFNFIEKIHLFKNYIEEAQRIPNYAATNESARTSTAHWSSSVEGVLRSELNWSGEEISEAPLTKALADYFSHLERQGLVTIFTEADVAEGEANAKAFEEMARKLGLGEFSVSSVQSSVIGSGPSTLPPTNTNPMQGGSNGS